MVRRKLHIRRSMCSESEHWLKSHVVPSYTSAVICRIVNGLTRAQCAAHQQLVDVGIVVGDLNVPILTLYTQSTVVDVADDGSSARWKGKYREGCAHISLLRVSLTLA